MKNFTSYFPSLWVRVIPIVLMFFCIGLTTTQAQNYKPLDEAVASVGTALEELKAPKTVGTTLNQSNGPAKTNGMSPAQAATSNVKVFEVSYYERFLFLAKENADVAAAVQALDTEFNANGQPASRATIITNGRNDLMHLITY
jgi:hypothetical protein